MKFPHTIFSTTTIVFTSILANSGYAQGGIYQECGIREPQSALEQGLAQDATVTEVLGTPRPEVEVSLHTVGHWATKERAAEDLAKILSDAGLHVSPNPLWNMDIPVTLKGYLKFGTIKRPFAVARWRVCFQDRDGSPWYFQWEPALPKEWKEGVVTPPVNK